MITIPESIEMTPATPRTYAWAWAKLAEIETMELIPTYDPKTGTKHKPARAVTKVLDLMQTAKKAKRANPDAGKEALKSLEAHFEASVNWATAMAQALEFEGESYLAARYYQCAYRTSPTPVLFRARNRMREKVGQWTADQTFPSYCDAAWRQFAEHAAEWAEQLNAETLEAAAIDAIKAGIDAALAIAFEDVHWEVRGLGVVKGKPRAVLTFSLRHNTTAAILYERFAAAIPRAVKPYWEVQVGYPYAPERASEPLEGVVLTDLKFSGSSGIVVVKNPLNANSQ